MDFAKGQETVTVAAKVDESCLQRRFDPCYLGEVNVAFDLFVFGRFEIKFFDPVVLDYRYPSLLVVARVDEHARCHYVFSRRGGFGAMLRPMRASDCMMFGMYQPFHVSGWR